MCDGIDNDCNGVADDADTCAHFLSDLNWVSAINGWGPVELDMSNGDKLPGDGRTIAIRGQTYGKGLGVHAYSEIRYSLPPAANCTRFLASIGVDDEVITAGGTVDMEVWSGTTQLFASGLLLRSSPVAQVNIDLSGRQELRLLVTDGGDGNTSDHADWASARVLCQSNP